MIDSKPNVTTYNAIDSNLFVDSVSGKWYLIFGSFWFGIHQVELDPSTGKLKSGAEVQMLAARPDEPESVIEAGFLFQKGYILAISILEFCI